MNDWTAEQQLNWFGLQLKGQREARGWTQQELAQRADLPGSQCDLVSHFEAGNRCPSYLTFIKLVKALGCDPSDLLPIEI